MYVKSVQSLIIGIILLQCFILIDLTDLSCLLLSPDADLSSLDNTLQRNSHYSIPITTLGTNKYYFGTSFKATWFEALWYCRSHGFDLVSIETKEEYEEIVKYLTEIGRHKNEWWLSGTDMGEEGKFIWMGTGLEVTYADWAPAQPDNTNEAENCLQLWNPWLQVVRWNDRSCAFKSFFICEILGNGS